MSLNKYKIEHKILSLAHCAVMENREKPASFNVDDISFSHWNFSHASGWSTDAWTAESIIEEENFHKAFQVFLKKMYKIIPRISLISQSYIEFIDEPFLITKDNNDIAFLRYVNDKGSVGLMFMEEEQKALKLLLNENQIPEEFYYYWNDAVNTIGYSPKLLLMFSAIEALVKKNGYKDWELVNKILGEDLTKDLFGTRENPSAGLRHRLVHGEYFSNTDYGKNYLDLVHKKIVIFFNDFIFSEKLIHENVVNPQRHFFGNKEECKMFIKLKNEEDSFSLKGILLDFDKNGLLKPEKYEYIYDDELTKNY